MQFLVIFLVILVLLMGIVLVFRQFAGRGLSMSARTTNRSRQPRLGIVDIYELDRQRQLILLRRDNVEHLLLVGGPNDVVVERNVIRSAGSRLPGESLRRTEPVPEPEPGDQAEPPALGVPSFEMPLVVPPPTPGTNGHETAGLGRAPPLDPALFEPEASPVDRPASEPVKGRVGIAQVGRILRRATPSFVETRPDPASEPARPEPQAAPPPAAAPENPQPVVPPSLMSSGPPRPLDPAALSDMARQLETALRRQSSAVTPPPGQGAAAPVPEEPATEPLAPPAPPAPPPPAPEPVIAQATARPNPTFMMARTNPVPQPPAPHVSVPLPDAKDDPVAPTTTVAPAPPPAPPRADAEPRPVPSPEPVPAEKPAQPQGGTPFTVEEIETEFARLLGRPLDRKN